jgi:hypothetical protein
VFSDLITYWLTVLWALYTKVEMEEMKRISNERGDILKCHCMLSSCSEKAGIHASVWKNLEHHSDKTGAEVVASFGFATRRGKRPLRAPC